jgi:hypothetical protein
MRWALIVVGLILDLMGTVWLLQGLSLLPGTFMRGNPTWIVIGAVMDVVGIALILTGARMKPLGRS